MQNEHIYRGKVDLGGGITVTVDDKCPLDLFLDVNAESDKMPAFFSWGTVSPGCDRLAFALLYHATCDNGLATKLYEKYNSEELSTLSRNNAWKKDGQSVIEWVQRGFWKKEEQLDKDLAENYEPVNTGNDR